MNKKLKDYQAEKFQVFLNNGGVHDEIMSHNYQEVISTCKKSKEDKILFEVNISLYSKTEDRFHLTVTKKMDFQQFFSQIKDAFELKYDYFKGLKGLRVKNLKVKEPFVKGGN